MPSVFRPRSARNASSGAALPPTLMTIRRAAATRSALPSTAPPVMSEWPPMYLVVECTTRSAPSDSGLARYGRGEGVVDGQRDPPSVGQLRQARHVAHGGGRVADRLDPDQARPIADGRLHRIGIGGVDRRDADARPGENRLGQAHHAAVDRARDDHLVAGRQHREHGGVDGGHARRGDVAGLRALQLGQRILEGGMGRVRVAAVRVAGARELEQLRQLLGARHLEGAGLVDRDVDRRLGSLRHAAGGANRAGGEAGHDQRV